ncbi:peptidoglycan DD-metalloendopeptidase family protein [Exilibacterium tricleocarpae]|uniref:Peptidoglycan DD-metalloendopeptidase family protein n=1 Tax=Exilibacterium tricleocarpae TaxID=2591008 RepID=A0A545T3Q3_9GAMM|nr:peptidoglycan DD-metalloendopeptidase family protein [Exilibacterium tricleocarpae]
MAVALTLLLSLFPSGEVEAKRHKQTLLLTLPETPLVEEDAIIEATMAPELPWQRLTVKKGDNLSLLFQRAGLNDRDVYELVSSNKQAKSLTRIHPGHRLDFQVDGNGKLQQLRYVQSLLDSQLFTRGPEGFSASNETKQPDIQPAYRTATITNSLFLAGQEARLDTTLIMELANIFGWDIDFVLDIRKGDSFRVLFEEQFLDGEKIGNGAILAAEFVNQGKTYRAVRYTDQDGESQYYTPGGKAMRKAFLRAPLDFSRISSNFNLRRKHPIHKKIRAHRGTDYAAARGTPVYASGSGRVIASSYNKANGNYVFIQHGNDIVTKYLHLHKRNVRKGQKVKQKQLIGTVGSTGYSTAPHLHYEFVVNGVHRNPRTILRKLPKAKSIPKQEQPAFSEQVAPILAKLDSYGTTRLALAEPVTVN